jgi:hypothetical protein
VNNVWPNSGQAQGTTPQPVCLRVARSQRSIQKRSFGRTDPAIQHRGYQVGLWSSLKFFGGIRSVPLHQMSKMKQLGFSFLNRRRLCSPLFGYKFRNTVACVNGLLKKDQTKSPILLRVKFPMGIKLFFPC